LKPAFKHAEKEVAVTLNNETRTAAQWFQLGRQCFHKPDGVGAVKAMERVIELDPTYRHPDGDSPHFYLGKISEVEGRLEEAVMHYTRALAVSPLDEESLIGRGSVYTVMKQHDLAVKDFKMVLGFPDQVRRVPLKHLFYAIAENCRQTGDWERALYWGQQALDADPLNERHRQLVRESTENLKRKS